MNSQIEIVDVSGVTHAIDLKELKVWTIGKDILSIYKDIRDLTATQKPDTPYVLVVEEKDSTRRLLITKEQGDIFMGHIAIWERRN